MIRRRLSEIQVAAMLLSRLPAGQLGDGFPSMNAARWAFPLVGLPVGLLLWVVLAALPDGPVGAALALGAAALVTGGLHHDGLADFADGMGGQSRARRLEIMRDSRVGSYGVIVLIFTVLLGGLALAELGADLWAILFVSLLSRLLMVCTLDLLPPARTEGLGQQASGTTSPTAWLPGAALALACGALSGSAAVWGAGAVMLGTAALVGWQARRRLGGQTGDVLGAVQLASETAGWVALAALLGAG